ncbi:hypothetical protein [Bythopirellula polymerisocia]|uniref:Tetratricopeptide repeat protein n=1 Tax=Bythopirellula polymerisocia TaxID=2528003 RepID=A0A5C6D5B7_9BACT|nr:hypothetical protein [Bythopirellula polymerisocia]TWU30416.1 Tetratricopeptide repeat protein [Bythopirellula polymerisocia]
MRVCASTWTLVLCSSLLLSAASSASRDETFKTRPESSTVVGNGDAEILRIKQLIAQLGSDDFLLRREAESQLISIGALAFDHLQEAQTNADLEIATQAEYLLHRITVDYLVRVDDPDEVRELMSAYPKASQTQQREIILHLAALEEAIGVGALSRIAHFELSPLLAKYAALAVLDAQEKHNKLADKVALSIRQEIGESPRDAARWLRTYADQLQNPKVISAEWLSFIDAENSLISDEPETTSLDIVLQLMQFHIQLCADEQHPTELFESLRRRIDLMVEQGEKLGEERENRLRDILAKTLIWTMNQKEWDALDATEVHYSEKIKQDRFLLYLVAIARSEKGQDADASEIAVRAYELVDGDITERSNIADLIAEYGHHDWAEKEWQLVIEQAEVASKESMDARRSFASWCLHDRGEDQAAANLMAEVVDKVDADPQLKQSILQDNELRYLISDLRKSREYFTACDLSKKGDHAGERKHLDLAYAYQTDMQDPDILIAMYRLPGQDEAYHAKVQERIRQAADDVDQLIEKYPNEAVWYNHWAWLVSNTEGDFGKAVRYSQRSLELSPDSPSYLDTLGRCYFAAGDLENAIKYQRQAVEKHPQVQVMRRQLAMFEKALAEGHAKDKEKP